MAKTVNAQLLMQVLATVSRTDIESAGPFALPHNAFAVSESLNASSDVPVTEKFADEFTATQNLDFTALVDPLDGTLDMTGLKLQVMQINNLSATNVLTISDGAANPYTINNNLDIEIEIGGSRLFFFNNQLDDVAAGAKMLDITPTAGQGYQVLLLFG